MQDKHIFEYAVLRIVPRVEREEFVNVGVVLYCRAAKFLQVQYCVDELRLRMLWDEIDTMTVINYLEAFERICQGISAGGPIGKLDIASRFRWLIATRSTMLQTSKVHPGFCVDPQQTLQQLFTQLAL